MPRFKWEGPEVKKIGTPSRDHSYFRKIGVCTDQHGRECKEVHGLRRLLRITMAMAGLLGGLLVTNTGMLFYSTYLLWRDTSTIESSVSDSEEARRDLAEHHETMRILGLSRLTSITNEDIRAANAALLEITGARNIQSIPRDSATLFQIFDFCADIPYNEAGGAPANPAEVIANNTGDCDEKSYLLALMIEILFPDSTRIIFLRSQSGEVHAFVEFDMAKLPGLDMLSSGSNHEVADTLMETYSIGRDEAISLALGGTAVEVGADPNGVFVQRHWLTLDPTANLPGARYQEASGESNYKVTDIQYPDEEANRMLRDLQQRKSE